MANFPLQWPSGIFIHSATPTALRATPSQSSPFTGTSQITEYPLFLWQISGELGPLRLDQAQRMRGFFAALRGEVGTFTFSPYEGVKPLGTCNVAGVTVIQPGSAGRVLRVAGLGAAKTLLSGSWIGLNGRLYQVTADATADASGIASLEIEPRLRSLPAHGDAVTLSAPVGIWTLDAEPVLRLDRDGFTRGSISFTEDF